MKAAILDRYDKNGAALAVRDIPTPEPGAHEVLVRVHTAAVNPLDNMVIRGDVRLIVPYRTPLVMGNEFSGTVVRAGAAAGRFKPGDRVYGRMPLAKIGAFAEYAAVDESALAHVPGYLSMEEAACVPLTALTTLRALELMEARPGQKLFISGGTGSLGAMAIPIAARMGLTVATNGSASAAWEPAFFSTTRPSATSTSCTTWTACLTPWASASCRTSLPCSSRAGTWCRYAACPTGALPSERGCPRSSGRCLALQATSSTRWPRARARRTTSSLCTRTARSSRVAELFPAERPLAVSIDGTYGLDQVNDALELVRSGHSQGKTLLRIDET